MICKDYITKTLDLKATKEKLSDFITDLNHLYHGEVENDYCWGCGNRRKELNIIRFILLQIDLISSFTDVKKTDVQCVYEFLRQVDIQGVIKFHSYRFFNYSGQHEINTEELEGVEPSGFIEDEKEREMFLRQGLGNLFDDSGNDLEEKTFHPKSSGYLAESWYCEIQRENKKSARRLKTRPRLTLRRTCARAYRSPRRKSFVTRGTSGGNTDDDGSDEPARPHVNTYPFKLTKPKHNKHNSFTPSMVTPWLLLLSRRGAA